MCNVNLPWHTCDCLDMLLAAIVYKWRERAELASGRTVQNGTHCFIFSSSFHPHSTKSAITCWLDTDCFQKKHARRMARFTCWYSAALVWGRASRAHEPWENSCSLASSTDVALQLLLYMSTVKRSSCFMSSESKLNVYGLWVRFSKVSVSSGILCQVDQAVFFWCLEAGKLFHQWVNGTMTGLTIWLGLGLTWCHGQGYPCNAYQCQDQSTVWRGEVGQRRKWQALQHHCPLAHSMHGMQYELWVRLGMVTG